MKALAFSGGKDSVACLHLLRDELDCAIFVDTGYAYPETLKQVGYAAAILPMHVVKSPRKEQNDAKGLPSDVVPIDWTVEGQSVTCAKPVTVQSYLQCCMENIAAPLYLRALELGVTELYYGQRMSEGHKSIARDGVRMGSIVRRHPIENWSDEDVMTFIASKVDVPAHYAIKHSSLDCYDCTAYRAVSQDRVQWTKDHHPVFFAAYLERNSSLQRVIQEASHG